MTTIHLTRMTLVETVGATAQLNATLQAQDDKLLVHCAGPLPDYLRNALTFHKTALLRYVSAFPNQRWPSQPQKGL